MSTSTKKKPSLKPSGNRPKAKLTTPRQWTGASIWKECRELGLYPKFDNGNFLGYFDPETHKKATTALPVMSSVVYEAYKKAESAPKGTVKEEKEPKKTGEKKALGRQPSFNMEQKIKVLIDKNPKRADAARRFDLYKDGMTVAKYVELGGKRADVAWDVKMKFISLS